MRNRVDISKALEQGRKNPPKKADPRDIFTEHSTEKKDDEAYKRDTTPMPAYYKAWDKFDIDKALEEAETGVEKVGPITYKEPQAPSS